MKRLLLLLVIIMIVTGSPIFAQPGMQPRDRRQAPVAFTPQMTRQLIDSIRAALVNNYIFPDTATKMVAYLDKQFKKGVYNGIKDPMQLADQLFADLQTAHHDGHLRIMYDPGFSEQPADTTGEAQRRKINDSLMLADVKQKNFFFNKAEILSGNIGYVSFNGFIDLIEEAKPTFTAAFKFVANTKALIIDLRNNGGGSPRMVNQVESYFFPEKVHMNDIVGNNNHPIIFWTDPAQADGVLLNMPVYILTSKQTFSGAEDFTYGLQSVKRAIVVGDTTGGGAHPTRPFGIGMGFVMNIPFLRSLNPYTHTDWEGTGVLPDIAAPADDALVVARKDFLNKQLALATTDREKKQLQWAMNALTAQSRQLPAETTDLAAFTGSYEGGLRFSIKQNNLYCQDAHRGNVMVKMQQLNKTLFLLDENIQVEFLKDQSGRVSAIRWLRSDGGENVMKKENGN